MLYGAKYPVYSEVNTKHTNTEGEICQFLSFRPVGALNQQALKD